MPREELEACLADERQTPAAKAAAVRTYVTEAGRGADLSRLNLSSLDLRGIDMQNANLNNANLAGANLQGAHLQQCKFDSANLEGANLSQASLNNADLLGANLTNANLEGANCYNARMGSTTKLDNANLRNADLSLVTNNRSQGLHDSGLALQKARNSHQARGVDLDKLNETARVSLKITFSARQSEFNRANGDLKNRDFDSKLDKIIDQVGLASPREFAAASERLLQRDHDLFSKEKPLFRSAVAKLDEETLARVLTEAKEKVRRQVIVEEQQLIETQVASVPANQHEASSSRSVADALSGSPNARVSAEVRLDEENQQLEAAQEEVLPDQHEPSPSLGSAEEPGGGPNQGTGAEGLENMDAQSLDVPGEVALGANQHESSSSRSVAAEMSGASTSWVSAKVRKNEQDQKLEAPEEEVLADQHETSSSRSVGEDLAGGSSPRADVAGAAAERQPTAGWQPAVKPAGPRRRPSS